MIHVVSADTQHLYPRQLDQMFRMRHAYYVEGHGWAGLRSQGGKEVDEFDDEDAIYLMSLDPWGDVAASMRLNRSTGPTLLKKFSDLAEEPLPEGDWAWDVSRWFAHPSHRRSDNPRWPSNHQRELIVGLLEFCQSRGITTLTMLIEERLAERIEAYGWPTRRLGDSRPYENGKGVALALEISVGPEVLVATRARTGILNTTLFEAQTQPTAPPRTQQNGEDIRTLLLEVGHDRMAQLLAALVSRLAGPEIEDAPRSVELAHSLAQLVGLEQDFTDRIADQAFERPEAASGGHRAS
ncbi:MAG: acyl-homoserine-lactone synthase [Hyphomonadaceae bacterium]